jgi:GNAT superfamily N-acetyltransferase
MSAYRFCRTDDVALLVEALNRCWSPYFPDEPLMTPATFKRSIRDLQVWCSSCMVAFSGSDPIGVLIGAKRPAGTLVYKIAVHPDHRRQGHARHLLTSLGSKLAILGPPRIMAEVPDTLAPGRELFSASGYTEEGVLTDYVLRAEQGGASPERAEPDGASPERAEHGHASRGASFEIPVTVDDLAANGLFEDSHPCWERSVETFTARKDDIAGLAVASDERIEAYLLYVRSGAEPEGTADIVSLRCFVDDDGARLSQLLSRLRAQGMSTIRFPKVHSGEISKESLEDLGFHPAAVHRVYAARARSN